MLLYFYHYEFKKGEMEEKTVEVIETPKTYKSAAAGALPWLYLSRMNKSDLHTISGGLYCLTYVSDVQNEETARTKFADYCRTKYQHAAEEAERWESRAKNIQK